MQRRQVGRTGRAGGRLVAAALVLALGGCDGSITGAAAGGPGGAGPGGSQNGGSGGGSGTDGGTVPDGGVVLSSELPCAAYDVLSAHCWSCHGSTPAGGAPQSLATLTALQASAPGFPTQSNGAQSAVRMQSTTSPMPPPPDAPVPGAEVRAFQAWVNAGMPSGSCVTDGGVAPPDAGPPPPPDPLDAAPTCTSHSTWTGGTNGSTNMEPGHACIACHVQQGGPGFNVGGTVYPTGHEPDDCNGSAAGGTLVTVTDSKGVTASFVASSVSGNFHGSASLTFPITARVTFNGKTRAMSTQVTTGDCNSCHTQNGASSAPGRITLPP